MGDAYPLIAAVGLGPQKGGVGLLLRRVRSLLVSFRTIYLF
jgi:hypothetical protein